MRPRRTLRRHAFLIALAVMLSPLILVMSTNWTESLFADRTREHTENAASEVATALASNAAAATSAAEANANRWNLRVRIVEDGKLLGDEDQLIGHGAKFVFGDVLYGPERKPVLSSLDRDYGELAERLEVKNARANGSDSQCRFIVAGNVYVCSTAMRVQANGREYVVHVEGSSRRALQTLYESRRQLVKLMLFAGALGLVLAWWTVRSFVKPVEALRNEMLGRATQAVP
ncbi:MAG: hypothetical protein ACJ790_04625, partial [Myxococcaceae bacterium]